MARCGRCGLWQAYPAGWKEKGFAGVCLWYQARLVHSELFQHRECPDFVERVPDHSADWHFDHKVKRVELSAAYKEARRGTLIAYTALLISLLLGVAELLR